MKRTNKADMEERLRLDRKMRKFAHYATRYNEHLRAVELDQKRGEQLKNQTEFILNKCKGKYTWQNFEFIDHILELILRARRCLANTYPIRFFMSGATKKKFFDFMQAELEMSLERLSKLIVKDVTEYIEMAEDKSISLKEDFFKFQHNAGDLRHTVEDHFRRIITQIKADFPDITVSASGDKCEDSSDDEGVPGANKKLTWSCFICTGIN